MAQAILVVAGKAQRILDPVAERDLGVSVVAADHEDQGVKGEKREAKTAEFKSLAGANPGNDANPYRKILECRSFYCRRV